jgi:polyferredoxin
MLCSHILLQQYAITMKYARLLTLLTICTYTCTCAVLLAVSSASSSINWPLTSARQTLAREMREKNVAQLEPADAQQLLLSEAPVIANSTAMTQVT